MKLTNKHFATAALALAAASTATAGTGHFNIVNGTGHDGVSIGLTVQESNLSGYDYEFVIENTTDCGDAGITGVYFEAGWASLFSSSPFDRNIRRDAGPTSFSEGAVSPDIAGWSGSLVSYQTSTSVGSGSSTTVAFVANDGVSLDDIDNALASQGFGLGLRLQELFEGDAAATAWALAATGDPQAQHQCGTGEGELPDDGGDNGDDGNEGNDGGDNGEPAAAPTPSAALMGLALLGLAAKRRRRD